MKTSFILTLILSATAALGSAIPEAHHHPDGGHDGSHDGNNVVTAKCQQCVASPNNCDITAPCASFVSKLYCACRPGYKAAQYANTDTNHQWRIDTYPGHEHRVWVAPGVVCNDLCDNPWSSLPCSEVKVANTCSPK